MQVRSKNNDSVFKLAIVTVPFSGHFKILSNLARELSKNNKKIDITCIITGWENIKISHEDAELLRSSGIKLIELNDEALKNPAPMSFTFPRVSNLTDRVINLCKNQDHIIYDFFSLEGYIAGKSLGIPHTCSIPAIIGYSNPHHPLLLKELARNKKIIEDLEKKYQVSIVDKLEMVSDGFLLPSEHKNIIWSWADFIKSDDYLSQRKLSNCIFMRPNEAHIENHIKKAKKVIYISLGTVVAGNLWNNVPLAKQFVNKLFSNIVQDFGDNDKYEVIISTGRKVKDIFSKIPKNFHVYETVPQVEILKTADVFITHGGGNSANEAIEAQVPMVVIPFFGDQHQCANNIDKLKIGISFGHDINNQSLAINTESGLFDRQSLSKKNALLHAVEKIFADPFYKDNLKKVIKNPGVMPETFSKHLLNQKTLKWQEGDLLYGCNSDREKLAEMTGKSEFFKIGDMRPFSALFNKDKDILPRIVDQYHDVLVGGNVETNEGFSAFNKALLEYQEFLAPQLKKIAVLHDAKKKEELLWEMCLAGMDFFIHRKQATIHFVMNRFNDQINLATKKELNWIKQHWDDEMVRAHVKFYYIQDGLLHKVDPVKMNWFRTRPTPGFFDLAPSKVKHAQWQSVLQEIRDHSVARSSPTLFFNHLPDRYVDEMNRFKQTQLKLIDLNLQPELAKKSLASGEVHVFVMLSNNHLVLVKKRLNDISISHSIVAKNQPVICAGEVRLRDIKVKDKWIKALDISNDSGHYMPDASGLKLVMNSFEKLGYPVYRVNVVHIKIPSSFNKVESNETFKPIMKSHCL